MESDVSNDLQQKYQLLAAEFAKVRAQCSVLKKAVIDEQKKTEQLQRELNESGQLNRKYVQEIDSLNFRNQQLAKRVETLQSEAEKDKGTKQSSSKDSRGRTAATNANDDVLRRELELRISENESLHAKLLETENDCRQRLAEAENKLQTIKRVSESSENALLLLRSARDKEVDRLNEIISIQEVKQQEKDRIIDSLSQKYDTAKIRIEAIERDLSTARDKATSATLVSDGASSKSVTTNSTKSERQDDGAKVSEGPRRYEVKNTVNETHFADQLRAKINLLVDALTSWLPTLNNTSNFLQDGPSDRSDGASSHSEAGSAFCSDARSTTSSAESGVRVAADVNTTEDSFAGLLDSASTFLLFKLMPALRTQRHALKLERDDYSTSSTGNTSGTGASSSKHAKLIVSKLDSLVHCIDALAAVGVRCASELIGAVVLQIDPAASDSLSMRAATDSYARPIAIGALVQAITDAHTLARRYSKLHSQRVSLLYATVRSGAKRDGPANSTNRTEAEVDGFASFFDRLEAEQIALLNCENTVESLLVFLKDTTVQTNETRRRPFVPSLLATANDAELLILDEADSTVSSHPVHTNAVQLSKSERQITEVLQVQQVQQTRQPKPEETTAITKSESTVKPSDITNTSTGSVPSLDSKVDAGADADLAGEKRRKSTASRATRVDTDSSLRIDALQTQTRLLEAQLRECVKRLQLCDTQKRSSIVQLIAGPFNSESAISDVRSFYEETMGRLSEHVQAAQARAVHFAAELGAARAQLRVAARRLSVQTDELTLVRTKYEQQLAAMSDHLAELNARVAAQHDELGVLRRRGDPASNSTGRR